MSAAFTKKIKSLGEDFRDVQYSDPEESWLRSGIYLAIVILFALAAIGVFSYKFAFPASVAYQEQNPSASRIKELYGTQESEDISQLSCACSQSGFTVGDLLAQYTDLKEVDMVALQNHCNNTLASGIYNTWASLCFGMRNTIGYKVFYQKILPTAVVVAKNDYHNMLNNLWAKSIEDGVINLRYLSVEFLWYYLVRTNVYDFSDNLVGYIDTDVFLTASTVLGTFEDGSGIIRQSWKDAGYYDINVALPSMNKDEVYDNFLNKCAPTVCSWTARAEAIDIVMDCIAVLGSVWGILMLIGGFAYGILLKIRPESAQKENDSVPLEQRN